MNGLTKGLGTVYGILVAIVVVGFLISIGGWGATSQTSTTPSNVTVNSYISFAMSTNLSLGIQFGSVDPGTNDYNATIGSGNANYNATDNTTFWVYVGTDSNAAGDFCLRDNQALTKSSDTIANGNFTYANSTLDSCNGCGNNVTEPNMAFESAISTSYEKFRQTNLAKGTRLFLRFWLDVPTAQPSGAYSNTVSFQVVTTGSTCS